MAETDAQKWDRRYQEGAYSDRPASLFLQHATKDMTVPVGATAADLACGRGRNTLHLAELGFEVYGYDISSVGLEAAKVRADRSSQSGRIRWQQRDLIAEGLAVDKRFDLIALLRFVAPTLLARIGQWLNPGGKLIVEEHLQLSDVGLEHRHAQAAQLGLNNDDVSGTEQINQRICGPGSDRFRVPPLALIDAARANGLAIEYHYEGLMRDPDGELAAVSQLIAVRGF